MPQADRRTDDEMRNQRSWILDSYLAGEQDGQGWALIDNRDADDIRHNLATAIERLIAQRAEVAALRAENERVGSWIDGYKREQEAIIKAHMDRAERAEAELAAERAQHETKTVALAAVEALLPGTAEEFAIFPYQIRAALGTTTADGVFIPRAALAAAASPSPVAGGKTGWDYNEHPGDCHPRKVDAMWVVCCRECAGTGVFPVPWISTPEEGRKRMDDSSCVSCKGTGYSTVGLHSEPSPVAGQDQPKERTAALADLEHALTLALQAMSENDCCADPDDPDWRGPAIEQFRADLAALGVSGAELDAAGISVAGQEVGT